ncbi:MAG: epoxyqueuosine reductase [Spirochaetales bacterium]|nr:MAG: epoxyqueuosine reductase [Spirochaetales bacterium]
MVDTNQPPNAEASLVGDVTATLIGLGLESFAFLGARGIAAIKAMTEPAVATVRGLDSARGAVVVALPYDPRPRPVPTEPRRFGSIGAFASSHRYATLARLLTSAGRSTALTSGLPRASFRTAVNSRLPEKPLAVLAGLAFIGRSSLAITRRFGPSCVLGVLLLPFDPTGDADASGLTGTESAREPGGRCGDCKACVDACPTGAIQDPGSGRSGLDRSRCIQNWASESGSVPAEILDSWGNRVYGCDLCVRACPYSNGAWMPDGRGTSAAIRADPLALPTEARPGSWVDLDRILDAGDKDLSRWARGTALGFSWFTPALLRRNAGIAATPR